MDPGGLSNTEVRRVVERLQSVLVSEMLGRDAVFERESQEDLPQLPLLGRKVPQLARRAANANELGPLEGHRLARRAFDLE
ncbi:MAG: hypothetical protein F4Z92_14485 [Gemmatimonadetes bacterium]|nr:hypothetical protein [Gemmatimonadota bacterium]